MSRMRVRTRDYRLATDVDLMVLIRYVADEGPDPLTLQEALSLMVRCLSAMSRMRVRTTLIVAGTAVVLFRAYPLCRG